MCVEEMRKKKQNGKIEKISSAAKAAIELNKEIVNGNQSK